MNGLDVSHESDSGDEKVRMPDSNLSSAFNELGNEHD
jgi:hypothetical protein